MDVKPYKLPNINRDQVVQLVKQHGPIIPNDLKRLVGVGDTMLLGAILSELASKGLVKITSVKVGGSPLYYDPNNLASLEKAAQFLNEKDRRTYALLHEAKIVRDDAMDALTRVSLRNIKDFAVPLTIKDGEGNDILFWKHFLVSNSFAEELIRKELGMAPRNVAPAPSSPHVSESGAPSSQTIAAITPGQSLQAGKDPEQPEKSEKTDRDAEPKEKPKKSEEKPKVKRAKKVVAETQTIFSQTIEELDDAFYQQLKKFFDENKIIVRDLQLVKRNAEFNFVLDIPSAVGMLRYYCKAKVKKSHNETDLMGAKLEANIKHLPLVYFCSGSLTKKAKDQLATVLSGIIVKEL